MSGPAPQESPFERLQFYRSETQFQSNLISNRTNAYLSSQSFLTIAYASSMSNSNPRWGETFTLIVPVVLALLGIVTSLNAWPGIRAAYEVVEGWHRKQAQLVEEHPELSVYQVEARPPLRFGAHASLYRQSMFFSLRSPWIFLVAWLLLGGVSVVLHLH